MAVDLAIVQTVFGTLVLWLKTAISWLKNIFMALPSGWGQLILIGLAVWAGHAISKKVASVLYLTLIIGGLVFLVISFA